MVSTRRLEFYRAGGVDNVFATLCLNKAGVVEDISPGPALQSRQAQLSLIAQARADTDRSHGQIVLSRVVVADCPLEGYVQAAQEIRLGPCPESAPIGRGLDAFEQRWPWRATEPHLGPPYPLLLEVKVPRSPNGILETNWGMRKLDEAQNLLGLLLMGHPRPMVSGATKVWVYVNRDGATENHLLSPGFTTGAAGRQDDFLQSGAAAVPYTGVDYYLRLWPAGHSLVAPGSLQADIKKYYLLGDKERIDFLRAAYWYNEATELRQRRPAAMIALATAIECLLQAPSGPACSECQKPTGPGPTRQFRDFLDHYTSLPPALEKRRRDLYSIRSNMVHGGHGVPSDLDFFSGSKHGDDDLMLMDLAVQTALIAWLRDDGRAIAISALKQPA